MQSLNSILNIILLRIWNLMVPSWVMVFGMLSYHSSSATCLLMRWIILLIILIIAIAILSLLLYINCWWKMGCRGSIFLTHLFIIHVLFFFFLTLIIPNINFIFNLVRIRYAINFQRRIKICTYTFILVFKNCISKAIIFIFDLCDALIGWSIFVEIIPTF